VERSPLNAEPLEIRLREAAYRLNSSVKECHVIRRVMKVTLDTTHREPASRNNNISGARQLMAATPIMGIDAQPLSADE
jgi:hypothetical protein